MQCQRPRLARQALEAETGESVGLSVLPTRACAVVHQLKAQPLRREAVANTKPAGRPSFGGRRTARGLRSKGERYEHVSRSCPKRSWSSRAGWSRRHNPPRVHSIGRKARPNPSLEATVTGKALGPRARGSYHRSRGPSAFPAPAPQLKLQGLPSLSRRMQFSSRASGSIHV